MSCWRFMLADSNSPGSPIEELDNATSRTMSFGLNNPGEVTFDLPLLDPKVLEIKPLLRCISVYKDNDLVWSGPIWTIEERLPEGVMSVKAVGWFEILNHRVWRMIHPNVTLPVFVNPSAATNATGWFTFFDTISRSTAQFQSSPASIQIAGNTAAPNFQIFTGFNSVTFEPTHAYILRGYVRVNQNFIDDIQMNWLELNFGVYVTGDVTSKRILMLENVWHPFELAWTPKQTYISTAPTSFTDAEGSTSKVTFSSQCSGPQFGGGDDPITWTNMVGWFDTFTVEKVKLTKIQHVFDTVDAGTIVRTVLNDVNSESESGISLPSGNIQISRNRSRTYKKYVNVGQLITELVQIESGFDWTIDPATKQMFIWYKATSPRGYGSDRPDVAFGYRAGQRNIQSLTRTIDGDSVANLVIAQGKYGSVISENTVSIGLYGARDEVFTLGDVPNLEVLQAFASVEVAARSDPRVIYNFIPRARESDASEGGEAVPSVYEDFWIGDVVYLSVNHGPVQVSAQAFRVFALAVTVDDHGTERIISIQTSLE